MVQVEALISGTPMVATDLPGVRQPVLTTGMGKIVPVMDAAALARGILAVLNQACGLNPVRSTYRCALLPADDSRSLRNPFRTTGW